MQVSPSPSISVVTYYIGMVYIPEMCSFLWFHLQYSPRQLWIFTGGWWEGRSDASDHKECITFWDSWRFSLSAFALGACCGARSRVTPVFLFFFIHASQLILLLFLSILKHLLLMLLGFPAHVPRVLPIDRCPLLILNLHLPHHVFLHLRLTLAVKLFLPFLINLRGLQHIMSLARHCRICMIHPGLVLSISGVHRHQALGLVAAAVKISLHISVFPCYELSCSFFELFNMY